MIAFPCWLTFGWGPVFSSGQLLMNKRDMCQFQARAFNCLRMLSRIPFSLKINEDSGFSVCLDSVKRPGTLPPLDLQWTCCMRRNDMLVHYSIYIWRLSLTEA